MLPKCISPKGFLDEAQSLYLDNKAGKAVNAPSSLLGSMVKSAAAGKRSAITGEEARKEMSHLDSKDLEGPVSPALLPSLEAKEGNVGSGNGMRSQVKVDSKQKSMAEKAKNYPFQH